jgi:hypothetical protein
MVFRVVIMYGLVCSIMDHGYCPTEIKCRGNTNQSNINPQRCKEYVRFQVITDTCMMMSAFWDITSYTVLEVDTCFSGAYYFHHQDDNAGKNHLWNVGLLQEDYTALYPESCHFHLIRSSFPKPKRVFPKLHHVQDIRKLKVILTFNV